MKKLSSYGAYAVLLGSFAMPLAAGAAGIDLGAIRPYSNGIINFINTILVPLLFAIAFLFFVYGVYKYFILGATSESELEKGRQFVLWTIIGFAVILSLWGLVALVGETFNLTPGGAAPNYPTL